MIQNDKPSKMDFLDGSTLTVIIVSIVVIGVLFFHATF